MTDQLQQDDLMALGNRLMHLRYSIDSDHLGLFFRRSRCPII